MQSKKSDVGALPYLRCGSTRLRGRGAALMTPMGDLLGPDPILLPGDPEAEAELQADEKPAIVAAAHPSASVAWAVLAEEALADDRAITAYAYARTGYHRGLDQLRRNGWKGFGPVPYSHEPNRGFLRCVAALARATHWGFDALNTVRTIGVVGAVDLDGGVLESASR